jgi:hypothetical protein
LSLDLSDLDSIELHQLVFQVDDLVERGAKQIASPVVSGFFGRIVPSTATTESRPAIRGNLQNQICKLPRPQAAKACNLKTALARKLNAWSRS